MRVYDMVVRERQALAGTLGRLTPDQLRTPSLCAGWTIHDIAAHLTTYLRFGQLKLYLGIVATAADIDRINVTLTRWAARRPIGELVETLHRRAGARTTIPRSGFDPVLTDAVLHDLDIRRPLGIPRDAPEESRWVAFHHLAHHPALGYSRGPQLRGLELVATDAGWRIGQGAPVHGPAEALLLTMSGRDAGWDELDGDGVPVLRARVLGDRPKFHPVRRLAMAGQVLIDPPPADRRTRAAVAPPLTPG
ncbi:maleylpyruvate isomerase family mycothiol-dependent enzyme [Solwaraspora sp. WMMD791]|uniref:maleylpyruvate isomerase family mycothiol-dependent enzyme n=1 Tax=Solwaraspora sp. WMMD791 TaxID=3016086 RepID=UPI00249A6ED3|nr:maleylpyruvate isomerase family mycothiol-dependent enzyme [Solwaraspora sp. WMMD791]WFE26170.1 maleylpyruvate isomerase family mycothiol-dependent enzyme [Solwaraspora sp. WMMD791]